MFGIKFISEREYERLKNCEAVWNARKDVMSEADELLKRDCDSLREQLNEKIREISKLKSQSFSFDEFFKVIVNGTKPVKCSDCENEQADCKKYTSGKYSVCILKKQ